MTTATATATATETDERGYAPTRIVRARFWLDMAPCPVRFFRLWAKPDEPQTQEERELEGEEHERTLRDYLGSRRIAQGGRPPLPRGGIPEILSRPAEEVGAFPNASLTREGAENESPRDWVDDFLRPDGRRGRHCGRCGLFFVGHAWRITCRSCAGKLRGELTPITSTDLVAQPEPA